MVAVSATTSGTPDHPPGLPPGQGELVKDTKMNKDVDMTKNDYTKNDQDGKIKFSCNKCEFEAEKEGLVKKHMIQTHVSKTVKKRKVMESARKDSVSKELKLTEGEDVDDILSDGDMFEDEFTSSQIDDENIDKLIEDGQKDLLDDDDEE